MTIGAGGGGGFFFLIIVAFAVLWFVLIRPQKRRQLAQQQMLNQISVGDQVVTAGGIYGEVTSLVDDEDVLVLIAPDIEVRVARRAIGGVVPPDQLEPAEDEPEESAKEQVEPAPEAPPAD
jgi:preprotein translocase subunit YajC